MQYTCRSRPPHSQDNASVWLRIWTLLKWLWLVSEGRWWHICYSGKSTLHVKQSLSHGTYLLWPSLQNHCQTGYVKTIVKQGMVQLRACSTNGAKDCCYLDWIKPEPVRNKYKLPVDHLIQGYLIEGCVWAKHLRNVSNINEKLSYYRLDLNWIELNWGLD